MVVKQVFSKVIYWLYTYCFCNIILEFCEWSMGTVCWEIIWQTFNELEE